MKQYLIYNPQGAALGVYYGEDRYSAFVSMMRDAGIQAMSEIDIKSQTTALDFKEIDGEICEKNGVQFILTQTPYCDDTSFKAHAEDIHGNEYILEWEIVNEDVEDMSTSCDWENFSVKAI